MYTHPENPDQPAQMEGTSLRGALGGRLGRSIGAQLTAVSVLLAVLPVLVVAGLLASFSINQAAQALQEAHYAELEALRETHAFALREYFTELQNDMNVLLDTVDTLRQDALTKLQAVNRTKTAALVLLFRNWDDDIRDVSTDPDVVHGIATLSAGFKALGADRLRALYLNQAALSDAGDGSDYSATHKAQHDFFTGYTDIHRYLDVLMIDVDGNVVYSLRKSNVFGANLLTDTYQNTGLAALYKALKRSLPGQTYIADVTKVNNEYAMFIGAPVYSDTVQIGILAYQLPLDEINRIVQERTGLRPSTESYLIGKVGNEIFYRSDRIIKQGKIGDPRPAVAYNESALAGAGSQIATGSTGAYELAMYNPLPIQGLNWAILTTGKVQENMSPQLQDQDFYAAYIQKYGYYDLLLIQPDGFVFYSVKREPDFESNLLTGPYKDSHLGKLVAQVLKTRQYGLTDFALYEPSGYAPAAFAAQPLVKDGQVELIVAVQLPAEDIDRLVGSYIGLGETGEVLVVGPDKLARSKLRNDPQGGLLKTRIDTVAINSALAGTTGRDLILDYRGVPVFNAWQPLEIPGADFRWVVAAKIDQAESLRPINELQRIIVGASLGLALLVALMAVGAAVTLSRRLVRPLAALTQTATEVAQGRLEVALPPLARQDEIGVLTQAFRTMLTRLKQSFTALEESAQQVRARTVQLEANQRAVQVVFSAAGTFKADEFLNMVVNLIRDRFNLYHVQIYLLDEKRENAVLSQSTGFAGQQLLARKHHIPLERKSLVVRAIQEAQPVIVDDVTQEPDFLANPLLPDTRSEIALPLKLGEQVIGALDAQSRDVGFFNQDMVALFQTMTDQIGLMFQNSRLFTQVTEQTERLSLFTTQLSTAADVARRISAILDPEKLLQEVVELVKSRFGFYHVHIYLLEENPEGLGNSSGLKQLVVRAGSGEVGRILRERKHSIPLDREKSLVARAARELKPQVVTDTALQSDFQPNPLLPQTRSELAVPLVVGDQVIGVLDMQEDQPARFTQVEMDTFATLGGQIAIALQNAHSFEAQQRAELDRKKSQQRLQGILESSPVPLLVSRMSDGKIVYANARLAELVRLPVRELLGRPTTEFYANAEDRDKMLAQLQQDGRVSHYELLFNKADGTPFWASVSIEPTTFENENALLSSVIDITARRQAEQEIRQLSRQNQLVLDSAGESIYGTDNEGIITFANPATARLLGWSIEELLGQHNHNLFHHHKPDGSPYPHEECPIRQAYLDGVVHTGEEFFWKKDGTGFPVEFTSTPVVEEGQVIGAVITFRDITERKQAEQALQKSAAELRIVAELGTIAATILEPDKLLQTLVDLIKERFNLYHAHIYLLDAENGVLDLAAGAGEAGRKMLAQGWQIPLDRERSLVARAARTRESAIFNDVRETPDFMPNPLLPETRAEMSVPLLLGDQVLGVLDVQSEKVGHFTAQDMAIQTTLAGQIATALHNAQLFEAQKRAEAALQKQQGVLNERIKEMNCLYGVANLVDQENLPMEEIAQSIAEILPPAWQHSDVACARVILEGKEYKTPGFEETLWKQTADILVRGEKLGAVEVCYLKRKPVADEGPFLREERALLNAVAQRIGDVLERRRAAAEIQKRAAELQTVSEITTLASSILQPDELLQTVVNLTKERFNLYHVHIYLLEEPSQEELDEADLEEVTARMRNRKLVLRAGYGEAGHKMREQGHAIPLHSERSLVARAARTRQGVIVNDVRAEPDFLPNPLLPETRAEMAIPLVLGDRVLGVLDVQSERVNRFTQEDVAIKTTLARQIASMLENARLFEESKYTEERLREVDRLKSEFLANMSHELRTPLNSIIGYSEVMLMGIDGEMDPETKEDVQAIYDNGKHLLNLINDILDLAKIEAGRMNLVFEQVDVEALLDEVKTNNLGLLHKTQKPVELNVVVEGELPSVRADRLRLNQVLTNLLSNAIKFTEQGAITLRAAHEDGWLHVSVQDTGIGISEADMSKLFEKFRQVDGSNKRRAEGTGLGLAITRHLVEMHGGTIEVQSKLGEGSTFTIHLPVAGPTA